MARIFRKNTRIPVQIDDCTFYIVPLSLGQKNELTAKLSSAQAGGFEAVGPMMEAARIAVKYSVKAVEGIFEDDDNEVPYQLELDENGQLTDDCVEDLSNFELSQKLTQVCLALLQGVPKEILDADGKPLEGVSFKQSPLKKATRSKRA